MADRHLNSDPNPESFDIVKLEPGDPVMLNTLKGEIKPVRLYILPAGSTEHAKSYCLHLVDLEGKNFIAQLSHRMLSEAVTKFGDWDDL